MAGGATSPSRRVAAGEPVRDTIWGAVGAAVSGVGLLREYGADARLAEELRGARITAAERGRRVSTCGGAFLRSLWEAFGAFWRPLGACGAFGPAPRRSRDGARRACSGISGH